MYGWISRHLPDGPRPPIVRPVNYVRIVVVTTSILGVVTLFSVAAPYILPVVQNKNLWAAITLIAILLFTSGHMFNHIRKVPYVAGDGKNGLAYFAGGFQNQFGLETQIVAAMCKAKNARTLARLIKCQTESLLSLPSPWPSRPLASPIRAHSRWPSLRGAPSCWACTAS